MRNHRPELKRSLLALALGMACASGTATAQQPAQDAQAAAEAQKKKDLDVIVVTGSRLTRAQAETALPLTTYTAEDIAATGKTTVAEVLRALPYNTQGSTTPMPGSTAQGVTDVNLRGLGFGRTLVLINGQRVPADSTFFGFAASTSFIPVGAVERIEILRDGASSVYGSDALAGVVNIVLKDSMEGGEAWAQLKMPKNSGIERVYGASIGGSSKTLNGIVALERRNIDAASRSGNPVFGSDRATLGSGYVSNSAWPTWRSSDLLGDGSGTPGLWQAATGCPSDQIRRTAAGAECRNPVADRADFMPAFDVDSLYASGGWSPSESVRLRLDVLGVNQKVSDQRSAVTGMTELAADNPFNPTRNATAANPVAGATTPTSVSVMYAIPDEYARRLQTRSRQRQLFGSLEWDIGPGTLKAGYLDASQTADGHYQNAVYSSALRAAFNGGTLDPFATSNPARYAPYLRTGLRHTRSALSSAQLGWTAKLPWSLHGGNISYGLGVERRTESLQETCDPLSEMFALSGAFCYAYGTRRSVDAAYVETVIPVLPSLELSYAGRQERYTIPHVSKYSQRVAARFMPTPQWTLRASWSQGMRAPNLFEINDASGELDIALVDTKRCAQAGGNVADPRCDAVMVHQIIKGGPNLRPETSTTLSGGVVWSPSRHFNIAADWYRIQLNDQIQNLDSGTVLSLEAQGIDLAQYGVSVVRKPDGSLSTVTSGSTNTPGFSTNGVDIEASLNLDVAGGSLNSRAVMSWIRGFTRAAAPGAPRYNAVGFAGQPKMLFSLMNNWRHGAWNIGLNLNRVGGYDARSPEDRYVLGIGDVGRIAAWTTVDASLGWTTPWKGELTLSLRNAFNRTPTINRYAYGDMGYNAALSDMQGRAIGVSYRQTFNW